MSRAKGLVEALVHYMPGSEEERIEAAKELLREVKLRKAVKMVEQRYALVGAVAIDEMCAELDGLKEELIRGKLKSVKPKRGKAAAKKVESEEEKA